MGGQNGKAVTIGIVADTHDTADPVGVVDRLARHECDYNVHLGDIGGSRPMMEVVRDFKRRLGNVDHLPADDRAYYQHLVSQGLSPMRAYIDTRLTVPDIACHIAETAGAYRRVLARFAGLRNPLLVRGNVDIVQLRLPAVELAFAASRLPLVTWPTLVDLGWLALLAWPSVRLAEDRERAALAETTRDIARAVAAKRRLVVLAHEQLFKGPPAAVYARRVAGAGLQQRTIPRFDPNPTWPYLLSLFRALPATVVVDYVFGHVHDPLAVMLAGAPALRGRAAPMRYRLYGLGGRRHGRHDRTAPNRTIAMHPVGVEEVLQLSVDE